jgi:hypothetical protein
MAEENNEGIAYLMALKRSAATPAPEPESPTRIQTRPQDPASPNVYQGAEKRRSPRYKCEGSVEMREVGCDVHTWASFTDVGLHGCYVEAQATYPVGTILQLKLEANDVRIETKGNVRVTYPYLGMGIAFVDLDEQNRERLRDLLASLSRPSAIVGPGIASSLPARGPLDLPPIANPESALQALIDFFRDRQLLMREDFVRLLRQSQPGAQTNPSDDPHPLPQRPASLSTKS